MVMREATYARVKERQFKYGPVFTRVEEKCEYSPAGEFHLRLSSVVHSGESGRCAGGASKACYDLAGWTSTATTWSEYHRSQGKACEICQSVIEIEILTLVILSLANLTAVAFCAVLNVCFETNVFYRRVP